MIKSKALRQISGWCVWKWRRLEGLKQRRKVTIYSLRYVEKIYSAIIGNELLIHVTVWMDLKNFIQSPKYHTPLKIMYNLFVYWYEVLIREKLIYSERNHISIYMFGVEGSNWLQRRRRNLHEVMEMLYILTGLVATKAFAFVRTH